MHQAAGPSPGLQQRQGDLGDPEGLGWRVKTLGVYLAGRYDRRRELEAYAAQLPDSWRSTARWLTGAHEGATDPDVLRRCAMEDLEDIRQSDVLVAFTEGPDVGHTSGGRHVETGYALSRGLTFIVVGPVENVFHHAADAVYATWAEALEEEFA